jgi:pilus assembly protein CpaB
MSLARILVLIVALLAGGAAAWLVSRPPAPTTTVALPSSPQTEVLVAAKAIALGQVAKAEDLAWRAWPVDGTDGLVSKETTPKALEEHAGRIARASISVGEPITAGKLLPRDGGGIVSVILPPGMRAVALEVSAESGAGGFILPNDRVDVLLTRQVAAGDGVPESVQTSTILSNVRVLAIDQAIKEQDGAKAVVGRTATLELKPEQAQKLTASRKQGGISLVLRALADVGSGEPESNSAVVEPPKQGPGSMNIIRFGVQNAL